MSSESEESDVSAGNQGTVDAPTTRNDVERLVPNNDSDAESFSRTRPHDVEDLVEDAESPEPELNGTSFQHYGKMTAAEDASELPAPPERQDVTSADETASVPDDSPSVRVIASVKFT